jgi:LPS O-antigen subunit length determinant protein (WzzB/FepE family)
MQMHSSEGEFQQSMNYKKVVQRFLSFKRVYIGIAILFLVIALIYNRTATVLYQNTATIMISEKERSALASGNDLLSGMAFLSGQNNIDNEIEILKSFSLLKETIERMDLKTSIYSYEEKFYSELFEKTNFVKKNEEYENAPIRIVVDPTHDQACYLPFYIEFIDDNTFQIYTKDQKDDIVLFNYIDDNVTDVKPYKYFVL